MKVVLIGAGGYIGRCLRRDLEAGGHGVAALSSSTPGGIDPDTGMLPAGLAYGAGIDAVIYLAQSPWSANGRGDPAHVLTVNVVSAVQAVSAAVRVGAKRFLYASTGNVYEPSFGALSEQSPLTTDNWYALSKVHAEQALRRFVGEIEIHILRLFGVYGPSQMGRLVPNLIERVIRRQVVTLMPGETGGVEVGGLRVSLTYIDDVVDAFIRIASDGGPGTMNVAGDDVLSIRDIAISIAMEIGTEPRFEVLDNPRTGNLIADNSLYRSTFGHRCTSFRDGLSATVRAATAVNARCSEGDYEL